MARSQRMAGSLPAVTPMLHAHVFVDGAYLHKIAQEADALATSNPTCSSRQAKAGVSSNTKIAVWMLSRRSILQPSQVRRTTDRRRGESP